ncbi:MAG: hypothetical protein M0035_05670, partial [Actinomycetota bacterium]|nr:hypothetical protein [Actinomycetota bacterium]
MADADAIDPDGRRIVLDDVAWTHIVLVLRPGSTTRARRPDDAPGGVLVLDVAPATPSSSA